MGGYEARETSSWTTRFFDFEGDCFLALDLVAGDPDADAEERGEELREAGERRLVGEVLNLEVIFSLRVVTILSAGRSSSQVESSSLKRLLRLRLTPYSIISDLTVYGITF